MATKSLTNSQEIVLSLLYLFSAILSILGSSTIVYKVLGDRSKATSYDRLMLGLSICDIIASLGWALTPFLLPRETSTNPWAIGNDTTCTFLGFITQLGFSAVLYNMFLSFYYLLTVRYGVKRDSFARNYEQWIHIFVFVFALITATFGAALGIFSEVQVGFGCWVNDYPRGCIDDCISEELGWLFGSGPVAFTLVCLLVNNILVYRHVRKSFHSNSGAATERAARQALQKKEVAQQGLWYVASFVFCFWAAAVSRGMEAFSQGTEQDSVEGRIYWIVVIQAATLPCQGFLNMFVYNRPNYSRLRAAYPELSWATAVRKACLDRQIPRLEEITWSASRPMSHNKYRDRSSSGAAFQSDLPKIHEEGESDEDSTDRRRRGAKSMVASRGDTNDEDMPDVDGTYASRGSFSISSAPGEGILKQTSATTQRVDHVPSAIADKVDNDNTLERRSNVSERGLGSQVSLSGSIDSARLSMDGSIHR